MLWVIGYIVIGLMFTGIGLPSVVRGAAKDFETDEEKTVVFFIGAALGVLLIAPFWPMWLIMIITKPFRRKKDKKEGK